MEKEFYFLFFENSSKKCASELQILKRRPLFLSKYTSSDLVIQPLASFKNKF